MFDFKNKVALVTGAAKGIGLAFVKELLVNGCKGVSLLDFDGDAGNLATTQLKKEYGENRVIFIKVDVSNGPELENAFEKTLSEFKHLDIVINNAAINDESNYQRVIDVNLTAVIRGSRLAFDKYLPRYKSGEEGIIVNISSLAALTHYPDFPVYTATKCAMTVFGKCYSLRHPDAKIRILTIAPGPTKTSMYDATRNMAEFDNEKAQEVLNIKHPQSCEIVGKYLIKVINEGRSGSSWCVTDGTLREVEVRSDLKSDDL